MHKPSTSHSICLPTAKARSPTRCTTPGNRHPLCGWLYWPQSFLVFAGSTRNETLRIKLGNAFDIVGERKQTGFHIDTSAKTIDESFEISVRNRKKEAATVVVREYLYRWSSWEITAKNHAFEKRDAQTIDFPLDIAADGEAKLTYTVHYHW